MTGQVSSWAPCMDYGKKEAKTHLDECVSGFVPKHYGSRNALERIVGCEQVRQEYEKALKSADPARKLPESYAPPNCNEANDLVVKWTGKDPSSHPCAGFDASDIAGHISKCFSSSSTTISLMNVTNCLEARRAYEEKLREAYGSLPHGYTMALCAELDPLIVMAKNYRAEVEAKEEEEKRLEDERQRQIIEEADREAREIAENQPAESAEKPEEIINDCDRLAAHSSDPEKPDNLIGIADDNLDVEAALEACMEAVDSSPENPRYKFQLGRVLAVGGAYQEAAGFLQAASDSGYAAAKFYFSQLYATGQGVAEDTKTAQNLYDEALAGGFPPVDFSQFGWPELLIAAFRGNMQPFEARGFAALVYIGGIISGVEENCSPSAQVGQIEAPC